MKSWFLSLLVSRNPRALRTVLAGLVFLAAPSAWAHSQSYGFLTVSIGDASADGRLELAIRDLDTLFDLDADRDGKITWGEFRSREAEIAPSLLSKISIGAPDAKCALASEPVLTDARGGETYVVLPFRGVCLSQPVEIGYDLMFSIDAQHRGLVAITRSGQSQSFVMTPGTTRTSLATEIAGGLGLFFTFVAHGAHHIWIGYDHILFLVTLLLGVVVTRRSGKWTPADSVRSALLSATKVVTAFTLSHSVTLGLAALGVLRFPTALTESAIAVTITLAAFNNIWPVFTRRLWLVALVFGLVHGVGFANVLAELDLPRQGLLTALFAFNLGVELGQLAIVAVVLPLLVIASRQPAYGRVALPAASSVIAGIGVLWLIDRSLGVSILPI